MAKRYGRNQRRAHREQIANLEMAKANVERRLRFAEAKEAEAYSRAIRDIAGKREHIEHALKQIGVELARAYPPALREAAEKIMASRRDEPPIRFDASIDPWAMEKVVVIRGEIPALRYNIAVR